MPTPGNPYTAQLDDLYSQIMGHNNFQYDMNGDMLYQQYKDQYVNNGRQAMVDAMGQANTMTGGYGNSYSAVAGNQAYQQYLTQLNSVVPQLEGMAYDRWNDDLARMYNQYNFAKTRSNEWEAENAPRGGGSGSTGTGKEYTPAWLTNERLLGRDLTANMPKLSGNGLYKYAGNGKTPIIDASTLSGKVSDYARGQAEQKNKTPR